MSPYRVRKGLLHQQSIFFRLDLTNVGAFMSRPSKSNIEIGYALIGEGA
jgi:hypothetical protein